MDVKNVENPSLGSITLSDIRELIVGRDLMHVMNVRKLLPTRHTSEIIRELIQGRNLMNVVSVGKLLAISQP